MNPASSEVHRHQRAAPHDAARCWWKTVEAEKAVEDAHKKVVEIYARYQAG